MTTASTFTEREPYEKGFAEVFVQDIVPRLDELERERLALFEKRRVRILITIVATVIGAGLSAWLFYAYWNSVDWDFGWKAFPFLLPVLVAAGGGWSWVGTLHSAHQESLREVIVPAVCRFFDRLEYTREPGDRFDRERFTKLSVVPSGSSTRFEDLFVGRYRDTDFKMVDAEVESSGESSQTLFDGLPFEIDVPAEFSGRVLIGGDKGKIGNALKGFFKDAFGKESRVQFDHPDFEDRYAVYASDADEARRLVSPGFCDTMVALADAYDKKSLGAAFVDGVFLLAVPVPGDLFEPGSIKRSVCDCEDDIHEFLKELTIAHRVIDYLHGERPERPCRNPLNPFKSA